MYQNLIYFLIELITHMFYDIISQESYANKIIRRPLPQFWFLWFE